MNYTYQKMTVSDDSFNFGTSSLANGIFYILFGLVFSGIAIVSVDSGGLGYIFYICLTLGLFGFYNVRGALKGKYSFIWGANKSGVEITRTNSISKYLWKWELVEEIVLMNSYRSFVSNYGKSGPEEDIKLIYILTDQSNYQKSFVEKLEHSQSRGSKYEKYFELSYCGATQQQVLEQLKKYAPSHVKIVVYDRVDEISDAANELKESWKRNI
jgi:hypothetical protein